MGCIPRHYISGKKLQRIIVSCERGDLAIELLRCYTADFYFLALEHEYLLWNVPLYKSIIRNSAIDLLLLVLAYSRFPKSWRHSSAFSATAAHNNHIATDPKVKRSFNNHTSIFWGHPERFLQFRLWRPKQALQNGCLIITRVLLKFTNQASMKSGTKCQPCGTQENQ